MNYEIKKDGFNIKLSFVKDFADLNVLGIIRDTPYFMPNFEDINVNNKIEINYNYNNFLGEKVKSLNEIIEEANYCRKNYFNILEGLILPLIECADWQMKPELFYFDFDYIYFKGLNGRELEKLEIGEYGVHAVYIYMPMKIKPEKKSLSEFFINLYINMPKPENLNNELAENNVLKIYLENSKELNELNLETLLKKVREFKDICKLAIKKGNEEIKANPVIIIEESFNKIEKNEEGNKENIKKTPSINIFEKLFRSRKVIDGENNKNNDTNENNIDTENNKKEKEDKSYESDESLVSAFFMLIGSSKFPEKINLNIETGESVIFEFGENDVLSFAKNKKLKVKNLDLCIEKSSASYRIINKGKTPVFVNNKKVGENEIEIINHENKVQFGKSGADYRFFCD